jgi:branched-subunit amino acid aminotransferase/4-amino-4-deoxychorismate lyase
LAKNYHWGDSTQGLIHAKESDFDNTLLPDVQGRLTEGPGLSVFIVKDNKIATPRFGVLGVVLSVTRINEHVFSNDAPGEIIQQLRDTYWN